MVVDTGDAPLDVIVEGEGPLVVALHGFPDSRETFREQIGPLRAAGYQIARPAMRGYAPSGPSRAGRYDAESLGRDVIAIADALSASEPVLLIGHDWGAIAGAAATRVAPRRFRALVTIAVPPFHLRDFLAPAQLVRSRYIARFQLPGAERALAAADGAYVERLWRAWSPGFEPPAGLIGAAKAAALADPGAVLGYYRALRRARPVRPAPEVPYLHVHGARDGCIGVDLARRVRAPARLEIFDGGHFVHLEAPEATNEAILDHFAAA